MISNKGRNSDVIHRNYYDAENANLMMTCGNKNKRNTCHREEPESSRMTKPSSAESYGGVKQFLDMAVKDYSSEDGCKKSGLLRRPSTSSGLLAMTGIFVFLLILGFWALNRPIKKQVCFENTCFDVELAVNEYERSRGLMFRKGLADGEGMLFIFETEDDHSFWMKNTLIPLDMVFIDEGKKVVAVFSNALPCDDDPCPLINPRKKSKYVLEINAGLAEKYGIEEGVLLSFPRRRESRF